MLVCCHFKRYFILNTIKMETVLIRIYLRSDMSAHVLLNLLNELGKSDKMRGLLSILSLFRSDINKFNNTGA